MSRLRIKRHSDLVENISFFFLLGWCGGESLVIEELMVSMDKVMVPNGTFKEFQVCKFLLKSHYLSVNYLINKGLVNYLMNKGLSEAKC